MNKLFASVGILALGAAGLQAAPASGVSSGQASKPWSISASLRAFYDDNYTTSPNTISRDSFGMELTPSVSLNLPLDQTFIGLSYIYSMRYFEDRPRGSADHSHQFNAKFDHAFTERYKLELSESFVIAQEPTLIDPSGIIATPLRTEGDNIRNTASADFTIQMTQLVGLQLGYANTLYDYEQRGSGSRSALLDRMEHLGSVNLRWQMLRQTVGILGYQYGAVDYTSDDPLGFNLQLFPVIAFIPVSPETRNTRSHYVYIGADHNFNAKLNGSVRVGAQYTDYYNANYDDVSPYADASLTYSFAPGSYLQTGVRHARNSTDVVAFAGTPGNLTLDQESTAAYVSLTHRITAKLTGSVLGQYQRSVFEGGTVDSSVDNFFIFGANLSYKINPYWTAETGYNFDRLDSDIGGRSYSRNRVYVGIRATY